jgi:hypothetical protein
VKGGWRPVMAHLPRQGRRQRHPVIEDIAGKSHPSGCGSSFINLKDGHDLRALASALEKRCRHCGHHLASAFDLNTIFARAPSCEVAAVV